VPTLVFGIQKKEDWVSVFSLQPSICVDPLEFCVWTPEPGFRHDISTKISHKVKNKPIQAQFYSSFIYDNNNNIIVINFTTITSKFSMSLSYLKWQSFKMITDSSKCQVCCSVLAKHLVVLTQLHRWQKSDGHHNVALIKKIWSKRPSQYYWP